MVSEGKIDASTIVGFDTGEQVSPRPIVGLTILYHPCISRIGEIASLMEHSSQKRCLLSRHEPFFAQPFDSHKRALETEFVSRTPVEFEAPPEGGVSMRLKKAIPVFANGVALGDVTRFSFPELNKGVVLTLGRGVVLLLHFLDAIALEPDAKAHSSLGLVGKSRAMRLLRNDILKVSTLDIPVLLQGESGVGKELVARAIHDHSRRQKNPYICINMAAIPPSLAARELFGAEAGAHTEAKKFHPGYFIRAHEGTLFLDEIGDTADEIQPLLLRAVENGQIQVLGGSKLTNVDVRLVAATDSNLDHSVEKGSFKLPLLQRLAGYEINIPPLRERPDDIGRLFFHFLTQELKRIDELFRLDEPGPGQLPWIPSSFIAQIASHSWPGNVRQLRNAARQLAIANRGETSFKTNAALERLLKSNPALDDDRPPLLEKRKRVRASSAISDDAIISALRESNFLVSAAASSLGVSRTWLFTRMDKCDRIRKASDLQPAEIEKCFDQCGDDIDTVAKTLEVSSHGLKQRMKQLGLQRSSLAINTPAD